ncbi:hypothetical protein QAD02_023643 [Eretmocerus hayati]|uniref:Uncharacterized protein n=1 Tax=Eretmocerus hayati TaxID=131215 RepID=A0ACC2PWI2_9HYME|nr:hypothetical protein QAD02_023643 [Eretmocerus hayati]
MWDTTRNGAKRKLLHNVVPTKFPNHVAIQVEVADLQYLNEDLVEPDHQNVNNEVLVGNGPAEEPVERQVSLVRPNVHEAVIQGQLMNELEDDGLAQRIMEENADAGHVPNGEEMNSYGEQNDAGTEPKEPRIKHSRISHQPEKESPPEAQSHNETGASSAANNVPNCRSICTPLGGDVDLANSPDHLEIIQGIQSARSDNDRNLGPNHMRIQQLEEELLRTKQNSEPTTKKLNVERVRNTRMKRGSVTGESLKTIRDDIVVKVESANPLKVMGNGSDMASLNQDLWRVDGAKVHVFEKLDQSLLKDEIMYIAQHFVDKYSLPTNEVSAATSEKSWSGISVMIEIVSQTA